MPRIARKDLNTPFLHVMVQGVNKEYIFYKQEYIEKYIKIIKENYDNYNFTILAYCIMNNHAHFLVYTEDIIEFGNFMHRINLLYANMYNKKEKRCGVLFRNRYRTQPIYNLKYLVNCIKYIHNNPVKAKIVSRCEEYPYSSYKDYMNHTGVAKSKIVKEIFGEKCNYSELFKEAFERRFMDVEDNAEIQKEYISEGIREFNKNNANELIEIFINRETLKELILFLKEECEFKYIEIRNFFGISRGTMEKLKPKI